MIHNEYRIFRIIRHKQFKKVANFIYYIIKFLYFRISLQKYLRKDEQAGAVQAEINYNTAE